MALTQSQLVAEIADRAEVTRADAKAVLNALEDVVLEELGNAEKVKIGGLGVAVGARGMLLEPLLEQRRLRLHRANVLEQRLRREQIAEVELEQQRRAFRLEHRRFLEPRLHDRAPRLRDLVQLLVRPPTL